METIQTTNKTGSSVQLVPPSVEQLRTARPQTGESSATTVPPSFMPNSEEPGDTRIEIPPVGLPSSVLVAATPLEDQVAQQNISTQATVPAQVSVVYEVAKNHNKPTKQKASQADDSRTGEPMRKVQRRKRSAPTQPKKIKRPRLEPGQANTNKRGRTSRRKDKNAKAKPVPSSSDAVTATGTIQGSETTRLGGKKAGQCINKEDTSCKKHTNDALLSQNKATRIEDSGKTLRKTCNSCTKSEPGNTEVNTKQPPKKTTTKHLSLTKPCDKVRSPTQAKGTATFIEPDDNRGQTNAAAALTDCGRIGSGARSKDGSVSNEIKKGRADSTNKNNTQNKGEATLEKKYEDLSRRYMGLMKGLMQASSKPTVQDSSDEETEESGESTRKSPIIDRKLYDTIYLCKIAGTLGALKIDGGPSKYIRPPRLEELENPYERIIADGFEFVEHLMAVGELDESCHSSVTTVFRDLHIRVLTELWKKNHDKEGGKALVGQMLRVISDQLKRWYLRIIDSKISIGWSALISEELVGPLYRKLMRMDEKVGAELATRLEAVLKGISKKYQEAEKNKTKASLEMFFNSCEVSICVARSVPEAALSLDEEDAYTIGRHNGVFSHCVARLQAEREAEEAKRD